MADRVNVVGIELLARGRCNGTYQEWVAELYKLTALLMGFVREGDVPSSLTQLLAMAMNPNAFLSRLLILIEANLVAGRRISLVAPVKLRVSKESTSELI
jgi:hypothetical protein